MPTIAIKSGFGEKNVTFDASIKNGRLSMSVKVDGFPVALRGEVSRDDLTALVQYLRRACCQLQDDGTDPAACKECHCLFHTSDHLTDEMRLFLASRGAQRGVTVTPPLPDTERKS